MTACEHRGMTSLDRYCSECGAGRQICGHCKHLLRVGAKFCHDCGWPANAVVGGKGTGE